MDANTTPIATSRAVLELSDGRLFLVAPKEVGLGSGAYPALCLGISECGPEARQWHAASGKVHIMTALTFAESLLPLAVESIRESDPLGEGGVSELSFVSADGASIVFRHIMPPMTLGIDFSRPRQAHD